jgi:hypothetical protein
MQEDQKRCINLSPIPDLSTGPTKEFPPPAIGTARPPSPASFHIVTDPVRSSSSANSRERSQYPPRVEFALEGLDVLIIVTIPRRWTQTLQIIETVACESISVMLCRRLVRIAAAFSRIARRGLNEALPWWIPSL